MGLSEGLNQGKYIGKNQMAKNTLLRQCQRKFGFLSQNIQDKINHANSENLETWLDNIIFAENIMAVFES